MSSACAVSDAEWEWFPLGEPDYLARVILDREPVVTV